MKHHCHANGCKKTTPPALFMCPKHWSLVPPPLQMAVWDEYTKAGGVGGPIKNLRYAPYYAACADAVEFVARAEGKPEHNSYRNVANKLKQADAARVNG